MKLLKTSLEKENDDHDVFGAYVAMEMRNLKTSDEQKKLRGEIRDAISRVVNNKHNANNSKELDVSKCDLTDLSANNIKVADAAHEKLKRKTDSWELIH